MTAAAIWNRAGPWIVAAVIWVVAMVAMVAAVVLEPEDIRHVLVEVCDDAVATLMKTKDLVELERSKYLITKLSCRLGKRLEPAP
jgi:hypothetical protein